METASIRPYQEDALRAILSARERGIRRALMVMPTGTGKTNVFVWLIDRLRQSGDHRPALAIAHREELLQQVAQRVSQLFPELRVGIERAESRLAPHSADVIVASVQTIGRRDAERLPWLKPGLIVLDEAHHALPRSGYGRVIERYGAEAFTLGVTATPKRLDRLSLRSHKGGIFEEVVFEYPILHAIEEGYLCQLRGYQAKTAVNLCGVRMTAGDFNEVDLAAVIATESRTRKAIRAWKEVAPNRQTIAFGVNVEHARQIAACFREADVTAEAIDGKMRREEQARIIGRYRSGETAVLCNCEIATEGFDAPETACILMLRPTQSWSKYVQMAGRGTRLAPGKRDCIIIDVVDNSERHSLVTLPAMLDLPANLDLEGRSLSEAAAGLRELGDRVSFLNDYRPETFGELETILQRIDLLARAETPPEVASSSALSWLRYPSGYWLSCGDARAAKLAQDALGTWRLTLRQPQRCPEKDASGKPKREWETVFTQSFGRELGEALRQADAQVLRRWPDCRNLVERNARWRGRPITDGQARCLLRWGYGPAFVRRLDGATASNLISQGRPKIAPSTEGEVGRSDSGTGVSVASD